MTDEFCAPASRRVDLLAAMLIGLAALATLGLILHHPVLHSRGNIVQVATGVEALAGMDRLIHGGLMAVMFAQAVGFYLFSVRLGLGRPAVAAGFLAFAGGLVVMTIPATLDGFVTPDLARACLGSAQRCGAGDVPGFQLVVAMIQDFTKLALVAMAIATLCWSIALAASKGGLRRAAAVSGLACAAAPLWILLTSDLRLTPASLAGIIAAQVVWSLVVAGLLVHDAGLGVRAGVDAAIEPPRPAA